MAPIFFSISIRRSQWVLQTKYPIGDEGWGVRPLPAVKGDTDFSWHLANSLVKESEFDLTICQDMVMDHGILVPLPLLFDHKPDWSVKTVPLAGQCAAASVTDTAPIMETWTSIANSRRVLSR